MNPKAFLALAALATVTAADPTNLTQELNVSRWNTNDAGVSVPVPIHIERIPGVVILEGHTLTLATNRVTNILSILSTTPVPGNCPECNAPSHHSRQVSLMTAYDVVYLTALSQGSSNTMRISTGSATNWVSTNLIPRTVQPYTSPGAWPSNVPPLKP